MLKLRKIIPDIVLITPIALLIFNYFINGCEIYNMNPFLFAICVPLVVYAYIFYLYHKVKQQKKFAKKFLVAELGAVIFCAGCWFIAFADAFINYFFKSQFPKDWSLFLHCLKLGFSNDDVYLLGFPVLVLGAVVVAFLVAIFAIDVVSEKVDNITTAVFDFFVGEDEDEDETPLTLEDAVEDSIICRKNLQDIIKEMPKTEESKCKIFKLVKENDDINLCFYLAFYFHEILTTEEYKEIVEIMNNCSEAELYNQFNKVLKRIETEQATAE